ncbi:hypothetical protein IU450_28535 [Nocardia abscessus]|uniref:hypothetical protein n=1 Tax=Nocardia abscessus TaxID=120957 RepID=UPI0018955597|nr:hypothetical protein [Nocardia abscessus]MBF6339808.1 hypothetical protein [Nocardia abscessus]
MSASTPAVQSLTRGEFERLEHLGYAGAAPAITDSAVLDRWRGDYPGWRGRYWAFLDDGELGVLRLRPVNVTRHSAQRAA